MFITNSPSRFYIDKIIRSYNLIGTLRTQDLFNTWVLVDFTITENRELATEGNTERMLSIRYTIRTTKKDVLFVFPLK